MADPAPPLAGPLPDRLADEIALLLQAEGIAAARIDSSAGVFVVVADADREHAARILAEEYPQGVETTAYLRPPPPVPTPPLDDHDLQEGWFGRGSWVVVLLAVACAAIFVAEERAGGSESHEVLLRFGASRPAHVRTGEWWRLVTAVFVHIGPRHVLGNVATLVVLGPALAAALGAGRFALVYVLAGAAGNLLSYRFMPPDVVSAGASGAILGVLGALGGQRLRFAASARYRGWQVIAAILAYLAIAVGSGPDVDAFAHVGGLLAGFALGLVMPPPARVPTTADRRLSRACGVAAVAILAWAVAALAVWNGRHA
ncbi:MAG TPA: rhomboid family intramembrane serine protease [Candidatus Binatia bacterium]